MALGGRRHGSHNGARRARVAWQEKSNEQAPSYAISWANTHLARELAAPYSLATRWSREWSAAAAESVAYKFGARICGIGAGILAGTAVTLEAAGRMAFQSVFPVRRKNLRETTSLGRTFNLDQ